MTDNLIKKSIEINASLDNVWNVLISDEFISAWSDEFSPGTTVEGEWELGGTITFLDLNGDGLKAKFTELEVKKAIKYEYISVFEKGKESTSGEEFDVWKDSYDKYIVEGEDGKVTLTVECVVPEKYYKDFIGMWDLSLNKIKEYSEWIQKLVDEGFEEIMVGAIPSNPEAEEHEHDIHTVHIILRGDLIIHDKDGKHIYKKGDRVDFPAGTLHGADSSVDNGLMIIGFKGAH